ncbi:hypothetical protein N9C93_01115 [Pelagibacterales bacterium]|nr:hypothetical protein [Pelagibacterales bacterium]
MTKKKHKNQNLLIATSSFDESKNILTKKLIQNGFKIIKNPFGRKIKKNELINIINKKEISCIIAGLEIYDKEVLDNDNLKLISRVGSGVDNIDLDFAKHCKIKICSTPTAPVDAVAEITIGSMISLSRSILEQSNLIKNKLWERKSGSLLKNKNIVIVGYGKIGKRLHQLLKPFNAKITIVDPFINKKKLNIKSFNIAIKSADIISFHINSKTNLINMSNIKKLKKGVILLNSSRGEVIDENSLIYGLKQGIVKSAWLDTFIKEPYYGKLCKNKSVILTPHCGSFTKETRLAMETQAVNNLIKNYL